MVTLAREANIRRLPPKLWHPALFAYETRNTVLLTTPTPVLPPRFYDTTQWRPLPKWNSAVYFDPPNTALFIPAANPSVPTRAPDLPVPPAARRNSALLFDPPNITINAQMSLIGRPVRPDRYDLTQRLVARRPLNIEYPPNLSVSILTSNPYVPIDISGPPLRAKRNSSVNFEPQNMAVRLSPGIRPAIPIDWNVRSPVRCPIVFDAPNLAVTLTNGLVPSSNIPMAQGLPIRLAARSSTIYDAQGTPLTTILFVPAVPPPGSSKDASYFAVGPFYRSRRNPPAAEWVEPQRVLLAVPVATATIPNLSYSASSGIQTYAAGTAFSGATSYSISPGLDAGITFNTANGIITTDTGVASVSTHGPYTITGSNTNGSVVSNSFTLSVTAGNYHVDGPRVIESTTSLGATYTVSGPHCTRDVPASEDLS